MVSAKQKSRMMDYLVGSLEGTGSKIIPMKDKSVNGTKVSYIKVDDDGLVLLVDRAIGKEKFPQIHRMAMQSVGGNVASVLYKDGKTFFRSAAAPGNTQGKTYKSTKDLSLKEYTMEDMHNMIELRPEEIFLDNRGDVQYFQPESERLEEGVLSYRLSPIIYDYSHIPSDRRFGPETRESVRLRLVDGKKVHSKNLRLEQGLLLDR